VTPQEVEHVVDDGIDVFVPEAPEVVDRICPPRCRPGWDRLVPAGVPDHHAAPASSESWTYGHRDAGYATR
jgi:hypothetical protein